MVGLFLHLALSRSRHHNIYRLMCRSSIYGHTHVDALRPVRFGKLSTCWRSQYYGGGPHGNTACCRFSFFPSFLSELRGERNEGTANAGLPEESSCR